MSSNQKISSDTALLLIDIQNDFLPGGARPVPGAITIIEPVNLLLRKFIHDGRKVILTRYWHPQKHISFINQGGIWPPHCVQNTYGAGFPEELMLPMNAEVFSKGMNPNQNQYSGFAARNDKNVFLEDYLRSRAINHLVVGGLALDYCVLNTIRDAIERGFGITLVTDATKAINANFGDDRAALQEIAGRGAKLLPSYLLINPDANKYVPTPFP